MLDWAREHGIRLINVDEVFHAGAPMPLDEFYRMELAKHLGRGYAAASDILRLAVLDRFGGVYTDGDNMFVTMDGLQELFADRGFAVHSHGRDDLSNSALLAARRHPFVRAYLQRIRENYALSQFDLVGRDTPEQGTRAANAMWVSGMPRLRRNSVTSRTGPDNLRKVGAWAGYGRRPDESPLIMGWHFLPRLTQFTMGSACHRAQRWRRSGRSPLRRRRG
jgi:TcdA/TcdB catalytic glycosyltransferase domain